MAAGATIMIIAIVVVSVIAFFSENKEGANYKRRKGIN
jgi:hypothetical protein